MRRVMIALVVVAFGVCAGIGVYDQVRHREAAIERARQRTPLQKAAADIDLARRAGDGRHFAVMPERLPPGLVEMYPLNDAMDDGVTVVTKEAPSLRHASIWLIGQASSAQQEAGVRQFWAETTWVPTAKAGWFIKLAYEGAVG